MVATHSGRSKTKNKEQRLWFFKLRIKISTLLFIAAIDDMNLLILENYKIAAHMLERRIVLEFFWIKAHCGHPDELVKRTSEKEKSLELSRYQTSKAVGETKCLCRLLERNLCKLTQRYTENLN